MVHDLRTPHIDAVNHLLIASYYLAEFSVVNNNTVYNRNVLIIDNKETQHSILDMQSFSLSSSDFDSKAVIHLPTKSCSVLTTQNQ